jgi:hypothetical protein
VGHPLRDKLWDRQLEGGLPDSRLKNPLDNLVSRRNTLWERVFCANCGEDGGLCLANQSAHIFYMCERCAALSMGMVPGCVEVDEDFMRGRRRFS